jgi:hypothetical protein
MQSTVCNNRSNAAKWAVMARELEEEEAKPSFPFIGASPFVSTGNHNNVLFTNLQ